MPDNIFRRGTIWWARFTVNRVPIRRSLRTSDKARALKRLEKIREEIELLRANEHRYTWKEAVLGWSEAAPDQLKPDVYARYLSSLRQIDPVMRELYLDQITRKTLGKIAQRPGIKNATRRRDLTAVSSVLAWCVSQGWIDENIARHYDRSVIRERRDPVLLPSRNDIEAVIAAAPEPLGRIARLAMQTGMRQMEIVPLEWSQIDVHRKAINLRKTKTDRARSVPLSPEAVDTISVTPRHIRSPLVFWVSHGENVMTGEDKIGPVLWPSQNFSDLVERVAKAHENAGRPFQRFRFHDLRHWFAVEYLREGRGSIYTLQKILGHSSIMTTEVYLDFLTPEEAETAKKSVAGGAS